LALSDPEGEEVSMIGTPFFHFAYYGKITQFESNPLRKPDLMVDTHFEKSIGDILTLAAILQYHLHYGMKTMDRVLLKKNEFVMKIDRHIVVLVKSRIDPSFATDENWSVKMNIHITQHKRSRSHTCYLHCSASPFYI
jgi:hypothetical protein